MPNAHHLRDLHRICKAKNIKPHRPSPKDVRIYLAELECLYSRRKKLLKTAVRSIMHAIVLEETPDAVGAANGRRYAEIAEGARRVARRAALELGVLIDEGAIQQADIGKVHACLDDAVENERSYVAAALH
ncbi:MAG: hypothetical protein K2X57_29125 [Xanthobacteraceae bacterium]|nr:hypothetical protein [Xanthobacteraceae bacterium]